MSEPRAGCWTSAKLGDLGMLRNGINFNRHQEGQGLPVLKVKDFGERVLFDGANLDELDPTKIAVPGEQLLQAGDVVIIRSNGNSELVGRSMLVPKAARPTTFSGFCIRFRPDQTKVNPRFVAYFVRSPLARQRFTAYGSGTGIQNLNQEIIADLEVELPSLPEQRAIAHILGTLDDKIELNRKMNTTLEAMARAIFKSWFVDFEPVRAKMEGRRPDGMDGETAALFPASFVESELGKIPRGWLASTVDHVAEINRSVLSGRVSLEELLYVEISAVDRGDISEITRYRRGSEPSRARRRLQHGDTVMSTVRPERRSFFLCLSPPSNLVASTGFATLTPTTVPWSFLHSTVTQPEVFEHLGLLADGGAYPAVNPSLIGRWDLCLPDSERILNRYHDIAGSLYERASANRLESRTLASLRDTLLPKLLSGQLRVPRAEKFLEAAV